jgi:phosphate-selective porin OprO and OprP
MDPKLGGVLRKTFIVLIFVLWAGEALAQIVESDERAQMNVDEGLSFSKDSLFLLNFRFRMQNRAGVNTLSGDELTVKDFEMRVRRLRLRLDGFVGNPKLQYYIQLAFSKADLDLETTGIAQPIRDAVLYYFVNDNFYVGFGQSKLPGNRQRVISSGNLQFADRSIANAYLTLDRDFGFFLYKTVPLKGPSFVQLKGVVSTGDGRNASAINAGLAYTGRIEYLPFGGFTNVGDFSEGDLEYEHTPKLSLGITLSTNLKATRTGGQLGPELFDSRNMTSFFVDGMFKYVGWAVLGEYMQRSSPDPITTNEEGDIRFVQVGKGFNTQVSKMINRKMELAMRYSRVVPDKSITGLQDRIDEALIGYSYYINGHRIKLQANIGYKWLEGLYQIDNTGNSFTGMFQVEFGI